jgi:signal transduction histidine kinase/DNA-binding response OmpR family regulator
MPRLLSLLLLAAVVPASADLSDLYDAWRWGDLGTAEGLPSETVHSIVEAADGTLWAGTSEGLVWFDGYRFHAPSGTPSFSFNDYLVARPEGGVLFHVDGILHEADRSGVRPVPTPAPVFTAVYDSQDRIVVLTRDGDIVRLGETSQVIAPPAGVPSNEILRITSPGEDLLLRTSQGIYRHVDGGWEREVAGLEIDNLVVDPTGRRYGSTRLPLATRGLWTWRPGEPATRITETQADLVDLIAVSPTGRIVVIRESGATDVLDDGAWQRLSPQPPALNEVRQAIFLRNGNLVLATSHGVRLHRVDGTLWDRWVTPGGGARNRANELIVAANGDVWIGTDGGLEIRRADGRVEWLERLGDTQLHVITALAEDADGGVWVGSGAYWDGAWRYHGGEWRFYGYDDGLRASAMHRILPEGDRLWFFGLAADRGSYRQRPAAVVAWEAGAFVPVELPAAMTTTRVYAVVRASDGALWIGGAAGIARRQGGTWQHFDSSNSGMRSNTAYTIAPDDSAGVWFGDRRNGLGRIDIDGNVHYWTTADGLVDDEIWELDRDPDGTLWIATRGGLGALRDGAWARFGRETGLESQELWPLAHHGDSLLVGSAGQGTFLLDRGAATRHPHRVHLEEPLVSEGDVALLWEAFSYFGSVPRDRIHARFRLQGEDWSPWGSERSARLTDLAAGSYSFQVEVADVAGTPTEPVATTFVVEPPYYARPEFYLPLGGLLVVLTVVVGSGLRRRREHREALALRDARYGGVFHQAPIALWEQDFTAPYGYLRELGARHGISGEEAMSSYLGEHPEELVECLGRTELVTVNAHTLELFGAADQEELRTGVLAIFGASLPSLAEGYGALFAGRQTFSHEVRLKTLAGDELDTIVRWALTSQTAETLPAVMSILDITTQKEAARAAEEANRAKSTFLANTSHEIRTPINAVMGMAQALQEEDLSPQAAEQVDIVLRASESLAEIIDDLLDLSKIEAGQLELTEHPFDPVETLEGALDTLRPSIASKGLDLEVHVDEATPRDLEGDRTRLRQILMNLLGNAVKFTGDGGIEVRLHAQEEPGSVLLCFEIRDTGIGIPEDRLATIFDPFVQADASITRTHGGTGLGLSISRQLARAMDGDLKVDSVEGMGSTFRVHLRVRPGTGRLQEAPEAFDAARNLRLLLVEDNEMNRGVARALLRKDEHSLVEVVNGAESVALIEQGESFDAILMDMQMPVMDGLTATQRIRELEAQRGLRRTPIVALTANAMPADRDRCSAAGMDDFLAKPVRREALRAVLAGIERPSRPEDQPRPTDAAVAEDVASPPVAEPEAALPVLETTPLEELRELEETGEFTIAGFIDLFAQSAPQCLQRARAARAAGDGATLHREVHTIKGSAREVGCLRLGQRAEFWERRLTAGNEERIDEGLDELAGELGTALEALRSWQS